MTATPKQNKKKQNKKFSRKNESLDPRKLVQKTGLDKAIQEAISRYQAEKYVKKHSRAKLAEALILTAAIQPERGTYQATLEAIYSKVIQAELPSQSTISRTIPKLLDPLWSTFRHYACKLDRNLVPREAVRILVLDTKGIPTKISLATLGYIKNAVRLGIKLGLLTANGVPIDFRVSRGDNHDVNFLDYMGDTIRRAGYGGILVLDSGFIDKRRLGELVVAGVDFVCRAKSNMKGDVFLGVQVHGKLRIEVWEKYLDDVSVYLFVYSDGKSVFKLLSSLDDPLLVLRLYRVRWSIEILFRRLSDLGFRLFGWSLEAVVVSVLVFLIALLVLRLYAILARRAFCVPCLRRRLLRWLFKFEIWYDVYARSSVRWRKTGLKLSKVLQN